MSPTLSQNSTSRLFCLSGLDIDHELSGGFEHLPVKMTSDLNMQFNLIFLDEFANRNNYGKKAWLCPSVVSFMISVIFSSEVIYHEIVLY